MTLETKPLSGFTISFNSEIQFESTKNESYALSISDNYTQNFTADTYQTVNQTIDLPCSLVSNGTLSYNVVNSNQNELLF